MVNIDTVYQKVLALANKEQRGYITPQEFNLMAHKAQMEIYNNYFHDLKTAFMKPKTDINHGDEIEILHNKMYPFKTNTSVTLAANISTFTAPSNSYFIDTIYLNDTNNPVTELTEKEFLYSIGNPLTKPTSQRPVYHRTSTTINIYPAPTTQTVYKVNYWKKPSTPNWGYVVVKGRALYNGSSSASNHFELHVSEEENLVSRILQLAGIIIQKPGIVEVGQSERAHAKQQEND